MDADKHEVRLATAMNRRPPQDPTVVDVPFDGLENIFDRLPTPPLQLNLSLTDLNGDTPVWFDDYWWTRLIERHGDDAITVVIQPAPQALLHPVVLHFLEMILRVAPRWRMVGSIFADDLQTADEIEQAARSPYHEIRIIDRLRAPLGERRITLRSVEEVIAELQRAKQRNRASRPVMVRLPATCLPAVVVMPANPGTATIPATSPAVS